MAALKEQGAEGEALSTKISSEISSVVKCHFVAELCNVFCGSAEIQLKSVESFFFFICFFFFFLHIHFLLHTLMYFLPV